MKHGHLWLIPLAIGALFVGGCGQKVTIKTNNGTATGTIDTTKNTATLNINGTTLHTGEQVSLPADFPTDVYVIPGTIKSAISTPSVGDTVSLTTTESVSQAKALYETNLVNQGWTITTSGVIDVHSAAVLATKGTRSVSAAISDTDGPTVVILTVMLHANSN